MPIYAENMGSSPKSTSSAETGSGIRDSATATSGGANTNAQRNVTSGGRTNRQPIITSINDNADIETSAALLEADENAESFDTPGSNYADAQSVVTPIRRISSIIHSEPIDIPARRNGNGHAATSPLRGAPRDVFTPGRPPNTGPRHVGPDPALLTTPVGAGRVVSPTFRRLMSPPNVMGRNLTPPAVRPSVSSPAAAAAPVVTADLAIQTDEGEGIFTMDDVPGSHDRSSVLSNGDRVLQITSPTDGVFFPVTFPDGTPSSSRARGSGSGTVCGPRGPRGTQDNRSGRDNGTGTVCGPRGPRGHPDMGTDTTRRARNTRDTNLLSSSVTSLMPVSSHGGSQSSHDGEDVDRTIRVRGPRIVSCGPPAHVVTAIPVSC
ncbi:uncharacterized protein F4807DRAFT_424678 [Annulohypoxylon truncatum]|uniref:uncharacterized protein n=1 Tax=Annulohypoxylon truncatum TaxID=327061 RepID=UPI002007BF8F|nr:uncharacterized protein F4807DRAFT_424678 [Annulohypoxylon truncatum]KAI1209862.1 hypothetical protein F4807DRAFT_424678 [Annulohypoxylon truncatum]